MLCANKIDRLEWQIRRCKIKNISKTEIEIKINIYFVIVQNWNVFAHEKCSMN